MSMTKTSKILLAIATIWPFLYTLLVFVFLFSFILFMPRDGSSEEASFPTLFILLHLLTMLLIIGLTVFYMVDVFRNDRVDKDKKVLWALVLFMGNVIAMPIYWYLYFWQGGEARQIVASPKAIEIAKDYGWTGNATSKQQEKEYVPPPEPPNWR